jgi:hypothetical protein
MKNIVVYLQGGLGNQLFQYYAGQFYATRNNRKLVLDPSKIGTHPTKRTFALQEMQMDKSVAVVNQSYSQPRLSLLSALDRILLSLPVLRRLGIKWRGYYVEKKLDFDFVLQNFSNLKYLTGYFQTYKYFDLSEKSKPQLIEVTQWYKDQLILMEEKKPIVIHFRGGDYFTHKNTFGVLHENYYIKSMEVLSSKADEKDIYVFSDDLRAAKKSLNFLNTHRITWVQPPVEATAFESLLLMSQGSAIIISNSTFSWWAAKFSSLGTIIIAPQVWSKNENQQKMFIPKDWLRVENSWI